VLLCEGTPRYGVVALQADFVKINLLTAHDLIAIDMRIPAAFYSRPYIAIAISEELYVGHVIFYLFFRPQIFRCPWADFRETLPHGTVFFLKYFISYMGVHMCP